MNPPNFQNKKSSNVGLGAQSVIQVEITLPKTYTATRPIVATQKNFFYKLTNQGERIWLTVTPPLKVRAVAIWILVQRLLTFSVVRCAKMSEIYKGLKTLPGGLHLERYSRECENCGVQSLCSFIPSTWGYWHILPFSWKTSVTRKRVLESEIKAIVDNQSNRTPLLPVALSQRFNSHTASSYHLQLKTSTASATTAPLPFCNTELYRSGGQEIKPLDRKAAEMKENVLVLEVQITSASVELQKLKA